MNWVVIENTFVIIGASIPLLRPLFSKAKQQAMVAYGATTAYEMNSHSRSQGGTKGAFSGAQHKSIALQSSSEENILPIHGGPRLATKIESENHFGDVRDGHDAEKGIKKETTVQVKYGEVDGITSPGSKWSLAK